MTDRPKPIHLARQVGPSGDVSAACYARPRAIDLTRAGWTLRHEAVTCPRCKRIANCPSERPRRTA